MSSGLLNRHRLVRHRGYYLLWILVTICAGLLSRSDILPLPVYVSKYSGDALWAVMIFFCFGFLMPWLATINVAGLTVLTCIAVECSQLYHAPWFETIRQTWIGRMVLGNSFGWGDLGAYSIGILTISVVEWIACRIRS